MAKRSHIRDVFRSARTKGVMASLLKADAILATFEHLGSKNHAMAVQLEQLGTIGDMYLSIQDIDLRSDDIRMVRRGHDITDHDVKSSHAGAQAELHDLCVKDVDGELQEAMRSFVDLSTLPERLAQVDTVAMEYLNVAGVWCRARFVVAERDHEGTVTRVLWLIESVDEEKRDRERLKTLSETDPLTGVRSKHAYLTRERELNTQIASGEAGEFALVVCDVNGLKKVNDTFGHEAGDEYVREACRMVCEIFQHSPVFRVGGDKFAAILFGRDFALRRALMMALHERSASHITAGGAVVSGGISDYRPGEDASTHDVFRRADERMCEEKKALKAHGSVTRDEEEDREAAIVAELDAEQIINVRRHVLVVDDEEINREILGMCLQGAYEVVYASDGYEALEQIRAHKEELALILLDLIMPRLSGIEVLKALKADDELRRIPVIVLTADQKAELECLSLGAMDFIPKPYPMPEIILARVNKCIELSEDRDIIRATARDSLTGLFNVEYFMRYVGVFDRNYADMPMDAIVVDVNHFHMVNERYGRSYGDAVLRRIGSRLRKLARELGGVGCRRAADTFLLYCPHREDYAELLDRIAEGLGGEESSVDRVRLRMGVYAEADKDLDIERRFDYAKVAADSAKAGYGSAIGVYDDAMHEADLHRERLLEDFRPSLEAGRFQVYFQPKYDVRPDVPVLSSAEALVRWDHPELGMISPGLFIPLLEENGLILDLDRFVWHEAASRIRDWKDRLGRSVPVSVNVSRIDMITPGLKEIFGEILGEFDLHENDLLLEITESAYTEDSEQVISTVRELRGMGVGFRIEMDDFGTGYSSLGMLTRLPIDVLKLDMSFVRSAFGENRDVRMIELIIDIADYLHVPVVAEGVETEEQYLALRDMGCDYIQGYYFSRPLPPEEFERIIKDAKDTGRY